MDADKVWCRRHWRVPFVYMISATLYAVIIRKAFNDHGVIPDGWVIPTVANVAGFATMVAARYAWFTAPQKPKTHLSVDSYTGKIMVAMIVLVMSAMFLPIQMGYGR
jgi:hypothetical protein